MKAITTSTPADESFRLAGREPRTDAEPVHRLGPSMQVA
jgi:hypothetical protein